MIHPDDFTLLMHLAGEISNAERVLVSKHLAMCPKCESVMRKLQLLDHELRQMARNGAFPRGGEGLQLLPTPRTRRKIPTGQKHGMTGQRERRSSAIRLVK